MTRRARIVLLATVVAALGLAIWALWFEPRRLVVRTESVPLPCWVGAPVRVAILSDLHIGSPGVGVEKLDHIVRLVNAARPDAVVLLGDFVIQGVTGGRFVTPETIADHLKALRVPLGTFAVLGNHDWWLDAARVARALRASGIAVLEDAAVPVRRGESDGFWIAGISDFWEGAHNVTLALQAVTGNAPVLAITHNPDVFPDIPSRVCLTLAGHTHGGQVAFPIIGRPVVPSRFGARYAAGHVEEGSRRLFVTTGIGTSIFPVRWRVPPEIVVLEIRQGQPTGPASGTPR